MLTDNAKLLVIAFIGLGVVGGLGYVQINQQQELNKLTAKPPVVVTQVTTPTVTATPSATIIPAKNLVPTKTVTPVKTVTKGAVK